MKILSSSSFGFIVQTIRPIVTRHHDVISRAKLHWSWNRNALEDQTYRVPWCLVTPVPDWGKAFLLVAVTTLVVPPSSSAVKNKAVRHEHHNESDKSRDGKCYKWKTRRESKQLSERTNQKRMIVTTGQKIRYAVQLAKGQKWKNMKKQSCTKQSNRDWNYFGNQRKRKFTRTN